jgi:hypothetical protein
VRQAVTGARRRLAHTPFLTARHIWLHTGPPLDLDVGGENRSRTPAQITLEANALRVMVSTEFPDVCGSPFAATNRRGPGARVDDGACQRVSATPDAGGRYGMWTTTI